MPFFDSVATGLSTVISLFTPLSATPAGDFESVGFYADEVLLCLERPHGLSARNALAVRVERIDPIAHEVLVALAVGGERVLARLTPAAVRELDLREGSTAIAIIKTSAIHRLGGS